MSDVTFHGDKPQTRDLSEYVDNLSRWVESHLGDDEPVRLVDLKPTSADANGFAGESFVLTVELGSQPHGREQRYLLKRKPTKHQYFVDHDFEAECRVQAFLAGEQNMPVAKVFGWEPGSAVLGSPFYLLDFVEGRPLPDRPVFYEGGWFTQMSVVDQRAVGLSAMGALAAIHAAPLAPVSFLQRGAPGGRQLDWDLAHWDRFSAASWLDGPIGQVANGRDWLERNKPAAETLVISWGDARPGNILFDGTDVAAVIDWDMASCGDREKDLGYWLAMDLQYQRTAERGAGIKLSGWPSRADMVTLYEQAAGRSVDQAKLRYHRIFAAYQIACMFSRYVTMRTDLSPHERAQFLNNASPPIDLIREELEAANLPGSAT